MCVGGRGQIFVSLFFNKRDYITLWQYNHFKKIFGEVIDVEIEAVIDVDMS